MVLFLQKILIDGNLVWEEETQMGDVVEHIRTASLHNRTLLLIWGNQGTIRDDELLRRVDFKVNTTIYNKWEKDWIAMEMTYGRRRNPVLIFNVTQSTCNLFSLRDRPEWKKVDVDFADAKHDTDILLSMIGGDSVEDLIMTNMDFEEPTDKSRALYICHELLKRGIKIERLHLPSVDSDYIRKLGLLIRRGTKIIAEDTDPRDLRMSVFTVLAPDVFFTSNADHRRPFQRGRDILAIEMQARDGDPLEYKPPTLEIMDYRKKREKERDGERGGGGIRF